MYHWSYRVPRPAGPAIGASPEHVTVPSPPKPVVMMVVMMVMVIAMMMVMVLAVMV
jgi:hypothetical protein